MQESDAHVQKTRVHENEQQDDYGVTFYYRRLIATSDYLLRTYGS